MSPRVKFVAVGAMSLGLVACAQSEPEPLPVQPLYDKLGNAECPAGYMLSGNVCVLPAGTAAPMGTGGDGDMGGDGMAADPGDPGSDPADAPDDGSGTQNQNENQNQNQNQNRSDTQSRNQNG